MAVDDQCPETDIKNWKTVVVPGCPSRLFKMIVHPTEILHAYEVFLTRARRDSILVNRDSVLSSCMSKEL